MDARIEQLFVAPEEAAEMESRESVECAEGGILGDRYYSGDGHYAPYDTCQVTLVSWDDILDIREKFDIDLTDGRHRRNVVVSGVEPTDFLETTFRMGAATLRGTRRRPPCAHVEEVAGESGVVEALGDGRAGICADVIDGGEVAIGDSVEILEQDPRTVGEGIAERLRGESGGASESGDSDAGGENRRHSL